MTLDDEAGIQTARSAPRDPAWQRAIERTWSFLVETAWHDHMLQGSDPVGRINGRVWRFVDYYLPNWRRQRAYAFMQTQAYWIRANWLLYLTSGNARYRAVARDCMDAVIEKQRDDGAWEYPLISYERKGLVATVEGAWVSIGLLTGYSHERDTRYLAAVQRFLAFLERSMGYESFHHETYGSCKAINYYWPRPRGMVPNNSLIMLNLWTLYYQVSDDETYLKNYDEVRNFLYASQTSDGEFWYVYPKRQHYLCFQYNAYAFIDLVMAYRRNRDEQLMPLIQRSIDFLRRGQLSNGACAHRCGGARPEFDYYTAVLAQAYLEGYQLGLGDDLLERHDRAMHHLLDRQLKDGSWMHSDGDYGGFLADGRPYPRYLAMTLFHLARGTWPGVHVAP